MPSFELSEALEHGGAANSDKSGVSAKAYSSAKIESKSSAASRENCSSSSHSFSTRVVKADMCARPRGKKICKKTAV